MSDGKKYVDIDDFGNLENVIKKVDPSYSDIFARLPGPVANYGQQKVSVALNTKRQEDEFGTIKPHLLYLLTRKG